MAKKACPLLDNDEPEPAEPIQNDPPTSVFDEGFIQIGKRRFYGIRTYSIVLIIILAYTLICIVSWEASGLKELALMACTYLFATKSRGTR